jgi:hypothetical protein
MTKTLTLETISYKTKRIKFQGDMWLTVSPFVNLENLQFGKPYKIDVVMDKNSNQWFIDSMEPVVEVTK